ncbi:hypothetical protein GCM10010277_44710 [Streptomyces longisporoflavus]|nr:hypothetical protein GCM10010277_44710 [Streptomyces longisporoflavus]
MERSAYVRGVPRGGFGLRPQTASLKPQVAGRSGELGPLAQTSRPADPTYERSARAADPTYERVRRAADPT